MANEYEIKFEEITGKKFPKYFKEHHQKLCHFLSKNFTKGDEDKAEEYSQRAFIQALEKIDTYDITRSQLHTWITKIAINLIYKDWKDLQKVDLVSVDAEIQDTPGFINIIKYEDGEEENDEHSQNVRKCEIIVDTIKSLQDKYRKVMIMREIEKMHYKDIADNIRKEERFVIQNKTQQLSTPEVFFSLDIENLGNNEINIQFINTRKTQTYVKTIKPHHSFFILRDDIKWLKKPTDVFNIISENSVCEISYITTTNLSTIKSQIKKGRNLIKKKVKRKFDLLKKI